MLSAGNESMLCCNPHCWCHPIGATNFCAGSVPGDAALEQEVKSLLTSHRNADGFLERPAIKVAAKSHG